MTPERLAEIAQTLQSDVFYDERESRRVVRELLAEVDRLTPLADAAFGECESCMEWKPLVQFADGSASCDSCVECDWDDEEVSP